MPSTHHGWYSAECASIHGGSYYKTPQGRTIRITCVTESKAHGTLWKDIKYVGEVTDWVGKFGPTVEMVEEEEVMPIMYVHDELTFKTLKNRTPPNPCPLSYTGTGKCTCGKCPKRITNVNRNPFGY